MTKLHAKSPCCRGNIYRFGNRRRQCAICKKTWRIRQKKTGRKKNRGKSDLVIRYLQNEMPSLCALARVKDKSERYLQARLNRSLEYFLKHTSWPSLPEEPPLVVIADAMVIYIEKSWHTVYFILLKEIASNQATIFPPYIQKGTETCLGWQNALDRIPETAVCIKAIICDGHRGLINYAKWSEWLIQRCHFHLIARLQSRRSKWQQSRHKEEGQRIYDLVRHVLETNDEKTIPAFISQIEEISWTNHSPEIRKTLSGFVNHYKDYRTYLYYPELNLPRTSNSAESLIGSVQNLCHRARGFCTISSFTKWISAFVKNKKKIQCNGFFQPSYRG